MYVHVQRMYMYNVHTIAYWVIVGFENFNVHCI